MIYGSKAGALVSVTGQSNAREIVGVWAAFDLSIVLLLAHMVLARGQTGWLFWRETPRLTWRNSHVVRLLLVLARARVATFETTFNYGQP